MANRSPSHTNAGLLCSAVALWCFLSLAARPGVAQDQNVLCQDGSGSFQAELLNTGVTVRVGASRNGELASRRCEAVLGWDKQALPVAMNASQIDIDALGADIGFGVPVATFQVKQSDRDCCMEYEVYSLRKPPQVLRTITGGDSFRAADTDLDGQVEIWTEDAASIDGFEGFSLAEFDSAPTVILRFSRGQLLDVSPEFQPYFDREITRLQGELNRDDLRDFKDSDGKLSSNGRFTAEHLHDLRRAKAKVLEIVWSYLYSGREQQAWRSLEEMWPTYDVSRVRTAILSARTRGIRAQINSLPPARSVKRRKHVPIFDAVSESLAGRPEVIPPEPILLARPPLAATPQQGLSRAESLLNLVIDSAGKVRSAEPAGNAAADPALIQATAGWKFIPAFKNGRAVACRTRLTVSLRQ